MIDEIEESTIDELAETELFKELETLDNFELNEYEVKIKDIVAYVEELNDIFQKNNVTIQPYELWLLMTKVHFVTYYETFIANVVRYRFHEDKYIIEVESNGL